MKSTFEILDARFEKERSLFMRDKHIKILRELETQLKTL